MNKDLLSLIQPELTEKQVRELCREKKEELGFDIEKALFPTNPLNILEPTISLNDAIFLVDEWDSVRDSVRDSVWASVGDSVWASVLASVRDSVLVSVWASVRGSVLASVEAYTSSIFYGIEDWEHIEHEKGANPFRPAIDLWEAGYIASYDGETWRLHTGPKAEVVWEGKLDKGEK